jgi:hypothetical protein
MILLPYYRHLPEVDFWEDLTGFQNLLGLKYL